MSKGTMIWNKEQPSGVTQHWKQGQISAENKGKTLALFILGADSPEMVDILYHYTADTQTCPRQHDPQKNKKSM